MIGARLVLALAGSTILAITSPAFAQDVPAFRVPMGASPTSSTIDPAYAWLETLGSCSTTCGTGTRSTSYQCQNVADYDYSGAGYGLPEPDSACVAAAGPKPASTSASCTVYSGCGYDWVKPPVSQTPVPLDANPVGRLGCGLVKTVYSPYCQRTGGGSNVVMANGDHRFCSGDRPDYDPVAAGDPDALGYDRNVTQTGSCNTTDHDWRPDDSTTGWGSWSSGCDSAATRTRAVTCYRRFDGTAQPDTSCAASSRPASSETAAQYSSCTYSYSYGAYGAWSSGCDTNATRTRTESCIRSNNGGQAVALSECTSRGVTGREGTTETAPQYGSCSYAFQPGGWSAWSSGCDASATRSRSVPCVRSNNGGQTVADNECTDRGQSKPPTTETGAQYGSCSYQYATGSYGSWSSDCSSAAVRTRSVTCTRSNNGGTSVADSECSSRGVARPDSSETAARYGSCGYAAVNPGGWTGWSSGCSTSATRTRQYQCQRSNDGGQIVADPECTSRGVALTETQSGANYASCTYRLEDAGVGACQNNGQAAHYWRCVRNQTGEQVDSAAYCGRSNPTYDACYTYELQDAGVGACQTNNQAPHYWRCIRRPDGAQVDSATYCGRANPTYDSCTYQWTYRLEDAGVGACQNNGQAPHYWRCIRNEDGTQVDSATYCGRSNPTYDSCYTYELQDAGVGACQTNNQAPHYWRCIRRPDGAQVDSATYCGRANPTYDSCTYQWSYTASYGSFTNCSMSGQQSRTMTSCTRSDGTAVSSSYCTNAGYPQTQTQSCTPPPAQSGQYCQGGAAISQDSTIDSCNAHGGNCVQNERGVVYDQYGYERDNPTWSTCYRDSSGVGSNPGNAQCIGGGYGVNGGTSCSSDATFRNPPVTIPDWQGDKRCTGSPFAWIEYCNIQGYGSDPGVACKSPNNGWNASSSTPANVRGNFQAFQNWCIANAGSTCLDNYSIYHSPDERAGGHSTGDGMQCFSGGSVPTGPANIDQNTGDGYVHTENWMATRTK